MSSAVAALKPTTADEAQEAVKASKKLLPRGGGSKEALSTPPDGVAALELSGLTGVLDYDPGEFTFTALAGTALKEVEGLLGENGQYMPFDPPLAASGATLGGTVAAAMSGPGRNRYGGVRDFILGVRIVDGAGNLVRGGGKVVKNAAGFDLPKLMVGSLGRLGVITEVSFKVFPAPRAYATLELELPSLAEAVQAVVKLSTAPFDLEALELKPPATLLVRLGGLEDALLPRLTRLEAFLGRKGETLTGEGEAALWQAVLAFSWAPEAAMLVKVPITPKRLAELDERLEAAAATRHYSVAGNLAWVAWSQDVAGLEQLLSTLELSGLVLKGPAGRPRLGKLVGQGLLRRVKAALDPEERFLEV